MSQLARCVTIATCVTLFYQEMTPPGHSMEDCLPSEDLLQLYRNKFVCLLSHSLPADTTSELDKKLLRSGDWDNTSQAITESLTVRAES